MADHPEGTGETLEDFKNSFSYGPRTDLSFKFLKRLSAEDAGEFFRRLLSEVGETFDDGDLGRIHRLVYEWQVAAYAPDATRGGRWVYDDGPFTPLTKPLAECRVGLLTSSGHFVSGDDPEPLGVAAMTQEEAVERIGDFLRETPHLSAIPVATAPADLVVRHGGYDVRSTARDPNVSLPLGPLLEAEAAGRIGEAAPEAWSFVGATSQGKLRKRAIPGWIELLRTAEVDALLLVPV